VKGYIKLK